MEIGEKSELFAFFLINKTKKYENLVLQESLSKLMRKEGRTKDVIVKELNIFLILKCTLHTQRFEESGARQHLENKIKGIYQWYWSKRQKNRRGEIRKDPEILDSLQILKESITTLFRDDKPKMKQMIILLRTKLDGLTSEVNQTLTSMMKNTFMVMWDLPGTNLDRIVIADEVFNRPIETGSASENMGEIADELILLVFARNFLQIISPVLLKIFETVNVGVESINQFEDVFSKPAINSNHKVTAQTMVQIVSGKVFGIRELLRSTIRQLERCKQGIFDFYEEAEDLGNAELAKFVNQLISLDDIEKEISSTKSLQKQLETFSNTIQDLLRQVEKREDTGSVISVKEKDFLGFVIDFYVDMEFLRFFTDTYQDVQYFTVLKGGIAFEADTISDLEVPEDSIIFAENLFKTYKMKTNTVYALRGVDINVKRGEFVAIMGPSGSGKTTLLNLLAGLDDADRGIVYIDGQNLSRLFKKDNALTTLRRDKMGFIFQFYNLLPVLSNQENVAFPRSLAGRSGGKKDALDLLTQVGLTSGASGTSNLPFKFPNQISGGQMQRVTIARSLVNTPSILFADEPTGDLDSLTGKQVMKVLQEFNEDQGVTIVLVTHDPDTAKYATRTICMEDGKVIEPAKS